MSTYECQTPTGNVVTMGYDPVLHRFFLVVEKDMDDADHDNDDDDSEYSYSNLDDEYLTEHPYLYQDLDYFKKKAQELDIDVPNEIWEKLEKDFLEDD